MRKLLITMGLLIVSTIANSQIVVDQAGNNWRGLIDSALTIIKTNSPYYYSVIKDNCNHITFFNATYSSTSGKLGEMGTIYISKLDIDLGIQNVMAAIVHESFHCMVMHYCLNINPFYEEYCAYRHEWQFLNSLPNPDPRLIKHAETQMINFKRD